MFCGNCGQQNPDGSVFCSNCGAALEAAPSVDTSVAGFASGISDSAASRGLDSKKLKIVGAAAGGVVALVLLIVILVNVLGGGETKPVDTFLTGLKKCDVQKMFSVFPDEVLDEYDIGKSDIRDIQEDLEDAMDDEDIKVSYEIRDTSDMKRSELRIRQDWYDNMFDLEVTDAKTVKTKVTVEFDGDKEKETMEFSVVEIDGKWYLDIYSNSIFYDFVNGYYF